MRFRSQLLCFERFHIPADSPGTVLSIPCAVSDLESWDVGAHAYTLFGGVYELSVAQYAFQPGAPTVYIGVDGS